jgi:hypothetical protein
MGLEIWGWTLNTTWLGIDLMMDGEGANGCLPKQSIFS